MRLPEHVIENLIRSANLVYPNGATTQGSREFILTITGSVSNAFRKCAVPIRVGVDSELRTLTGLTVFIRDSFFTVPIMLLGGIVTLGKERFSVEHTGSVALLVRAIFKVIETGTPAGAAP